MDNFKTHLPTLEVLYSFELALKDEECHHKLNAIDMEFFKLSIAKYDEFNESLAAKNEEISRQRDALREIQRLNPHNKEVSDIVNRLLN